MARPMGPSPADPSGRSPLTTTTYPDKEFLRHLDEGVPLGVDGPMLPDPDIWPSKQELGATAENYPSAQLFEDVIESTFMDEKLLDMVEGPLSEQEAADLCGCLINDLCVGAMAGIQEVDKVRAIFDATIVGVNDNIRANTDKKTTAPTLYDLLFAKLHLLDANLTLFKSDVSKAHRRIKVLKKHWKYMVAKIKDKFWVNKVGTYGVASAQLYWGRLAAILTCVSYHISETFLWVLVFVDDFMALMPAQQGDIGRATLMLFLTLVGCPICWHKNVLGKEIQRLRLAAG